LFKKKDPYENLREVLNTVYGQLWSIKKIELCNAYCEISNISFNNLFNKWLNIKFIINFPIDFLNWF
jgi:hypothetical protein